jgi:hypothetical protein
MMTLKSRIALTALALLVTDVATSQEPFFYPPKGSTEKQQRQDAFECHEWAVEQSKFDPVEFAANQGATKTTAPTQQSQQKGYDPNQAGRSMIGGAATGAVIGEVANNDAGQGAIAGGSLGLLRGKMAEKKAAAEREASQSQAQKQAQQQQSAQSQDVKTKLDGYQRARATCFKGRGYTVSEG